MFVIMRIVDEYMCVVHITKKDMERERGTQEDINV